MRNQPVLLFGGIVAFAVLAAVVFALERSDDARSQPDMGKVAYVVDGNIWVRDLPGGTARQLTDTGGDLAPEWSASGEWLSFTRESPPGGRATTWLMRADGSESHRMRDVSRVSWAPHEDWFVYWDQDDGLVRLDANDLENPFLLMPEPEDGHHAMMPGMYPWSPDGDWIVLRNIFPRPWGTPDERAYHVYRIASEGSEPQSFFRIDAFESDDPQAQRRNVLIRELGWAPDGRHFILTVEVAPEDGEAQRATRADPSTPPPPGPGLDVLIVNVEDGTITETDIQSPSWLLQPSPSENSLLVLTGETRGDWQHYDLVLLEPESGDTTVLTQDDLSVLNAGWSPEGDRIIFSAGPAPDGAPVYLSPEMTDAFAERRLWSMQRDGTGLTQLTDDPRYRDEEPHWLPGGDHVLFVRIDVEAPASTLSLWLLDLTTGDTELIAADLHPSHDRTPGGVIPDIRDYSSSSWQVYYTHWQP